MSDRFPGSKREARREARAYVYNICAAMLEAQYNTAPENREGWMFGGLEEEDDRRLVYEEIKRLESELLKRGAKLRDER